MIFYKLAKLIFSFKKSSTKNHYFHQQKKNPKPKGLGFLYHIKYFKENVTQSW